MRLRDIRLSFETGLLNVPTTRLFEFFISIPFEIFISPGYSPLLLRSLRSEYA